MSSDLYSETSYTGKVWTLLERRPYEQHSSLEILVQREDGGDALIALKISRAQFVQLKRVNMEPDKRISVTCHYVDGTRTLMAWREDARPGPVLTEDKLNRIAQRLRFLK